VVVGQMAPNGQLRILKEMHRPNILFRDFLNTVVVPELQQLYPLHKMLWVMDPAGSSHTALTRDTAKGVLQSYGFQVVLASTNDLDPRLRSVEHWLTTSLLDQPALLVDPSCIEVIHGFEGRYRYMRDTKGELKPKPEKKHPVSDVHDCIQYMCLALSGKRVQREVAASQAYSGMGPPAYPREERPAWRGR